MVGAVGARGILGTIGDDEPCIIMGVAGLVNTSPPAVVVEGKERPFR
jgi:hypothetical protein